MNNGEDSISKSRLLATSKTTITMKRLMMKRLFTQIIKEQ